MKVKSIVIVATAICITGCVTGGAKQTGGTLVGGATGALVGSQFGKGHGKLASVAVGTMLGSLVGGSIGKSMDEEDKRLAANTTHNTLERQPDNQTVTWRNPNNNHAGTMRVTKTVENNNLVCRDYVQTVIIDGRQEQVAGRACRDVRDPKGQWFNQR